MSDFYIAIAAANEAKHAMIQAIRALLSNEAIEAAIASYGEAVIHSYHVEMRYRANYVVPIIESQIVREQLWLRRMTNANAALRDHTQTLGIDTEAIEGTWRFVHARDSPEVRRRFWTEPGEGEREAVEHTFRVAFFQDSAAILNVIDEH